MPKAVGFEELLELAKSSGHAINIRPDGRIEINPGQDRYELAKVACKGFEDEKMDACLEGYLLGYNTREKRVGTVSIKKKDGLKDFIRRNW